MHNVHERTITWDEKRQEWRCDLGDGHTVLIAKTLIGMERSLDLVELYICQQKKRRKGK